MDHKDFVAALPAETRTELTRTSDAAGLWHLAGHWGAIGLVTAGILLPVPLWWALVPVQGVLLVFLFTLLHETSHRTPFRSEALNLWVGRICGAVLFLPATWFRYFHFAHHRYTQIPGKDPELAEPKPETPWEYLRHLSGLPVWAGQSRTLWRTATGGDPGDFVPKARVAEVRREARWMLGLYGVLFLGSVVAGSAVLIWGWLFPLMLGQPVLRLYLLAEHGRCAFVANMLENSRTTFTNRAVRFLAWNMPYHAEHHAYPSVPFHRLPDLHRLARPHLAETEAGYAGFHRRYAKGLRRA
ncbi:fatty acid desaturase [Histidinibacterium aquaticum]|uniref:Fatty acid desaturase n=1 Tax=Histidinibacterium aquaticum TaxID=2613962 RepID=A0A5J5GM88_9RHOB|nr:fatty acid desaturase [Histidinibacterium aquaticum]KAA9009315.1 fatty acid desaturase [Histidinibacterium aquaticum]